MAVKRGVARVADVRQRGLGRGAGVRAQRLERGALCRNVRVVVRVVGESEVTQSPNREHTGRALSELAGELIGDGDGRDVRAPVVRRQVASHPPRTGAARDGALPTATGHFVGEAVVGVSAALDHRDFAEVVELFEPDQSWMQRERSARVRVAADRSRRELCRGQSNPARAGLARCLIGVAQVAGAAVGDRRDGVEPVIAAVEEDDDEISIADGLCECLLHPRRCGRGWDRGSCRLLPAHCG